VFASQGRIGKFYVGRQLLFIITEAVSEIIYIYMCVCVCVCVCDAL
jgi:hypothetical protein